MSNEDMRETRNQTGDCQPIAAEPDDNSECTTNEVRTGDLENYQRAVGTVSDPDFRLPVEMTPVALATTVGRRHESRKED